MISSKRKRSSLWIFALLTVLVTGVAMGGLHRLNQSSGEPSGAEARPDEPAAADSERPPDRAIALEGERITLRPVQRSVGAVGSFFGYDEVTVTAEVTGRVAKVHHDVGDIVRPGDVLMELDTTDFGLELEQTRRALELDVIRLGVKVPAEPLSPDQIAVLLRAFQIDSLPSLKRAQQLERLAWLRLQRAEQLRQANAMSEEESQQRKSEYDVAKSALDQANYDADAALAGIGHHPCADADAA
jgi:multidrug efflux pump subunit AcrA (membrane-fusion protein)